MSLRPSTVLGSALFVFYCTAVGVYLVLRPWSAVIAGAPLVGSGFFRGFVSGLGLVHLVVAGSDLKVLSRELSAPASEERTEGAPG